MAPVFPCTRKRRRALSRDAASLPSDQRSWMGLTEEFGIHVAAGKDDRNATAVGPIGGRRDLAAQNGSQGDRTARFQDQLQGPESKGHGGPSLVVADSDAAVQEPLVDREGQLAGRRRHQGIADGPGRTRVGDSLASFQGASGVVEAGRLDGMDPRPRTQFLEGQGAACREAAATAADQKAIDFQSPGGSLHRDLASAGTLSRHDALVVVGAHQRRASLLKGSAGQWFRDPPRRAGRVRPSPRSRGCSRSLSAGRRAA